ncbi:MAG: hypothetical protein H7Y18_15365 [Clostridiaceae bacterium]|nr:hypothetical protein [Clostridiaceae bacterium]
MGDRRLIENYYTDYYNLIDILCKLTNNYRLLIGGAGEINQITLAHKKDVKKALKRVRVVGDMIDDILSILEKTEVSYFDYCRIKADVVKEKLEFEYVKSEVEALVALNEEKKV